VRRSLFHSALQAQVHIGKGIASCMHVRINVHNEDNICPALPQRLPRAVQRRPPRCTMRLINVNTLELQSFNEDAIPDYAILSHTWGADEVSYQEIVWIDRLKSASKPIDQTAAPSSSTSSSTSETTQETQSAAILARLERTLRNYLNLAASPNGVTQEDILRKSGYEKIVNAANTARDLDCEWLWVDCCCIDKTSSAELQEAINSMYRWYREATICLVYLGDIASATFDPTSSNLEVVEMAFHTCRWIKRGWTLQELVASADCKFYFQDWKFMIDKSECLNELSRATGIPTSVLDDPQSIHEVSVAQRMSWASGRETTRREDVGYCLLGLFDIQLPLLYGEGDKAFIRLQEEILKTTDDYSLFAWSAPASDNSNYRGLLARSPAEFRNCGSVERFTTTSVLPISTSPIGLRIQLGVSPDPDDETRVLAMIRSYNSKRQPLVIYLKCLDGATQYARVNVASTIAMDGWMAGELRTMYVRQKLSVPANFTTKDFSHFHLRRRFSEHYKGPQVSLIGVPNKGWDWSNYHQRIVASAFEMTAVFLLGVEQTGLAFPVAVAFNPETGHYWCKTFAELVTNFTNPPRPWDGEDWRATVMRHVTKEVRTSLRGVEAHHDVFRFGGLQIKIGVKAGLCGDTIGLQVHIDGLTTYLRGLIC
jgi:hypothetical protein